MSNEPTESDIVRQVYGGILASVGECVKKHLEPAYRDATPMAILIDRVTTRKTADLEAIIDRAFDAALGADFGERLKEAVSHKLARVLISKCEGEIEKRANTLRSDPAFRARLTIAIDTAIREIGR